MSSYFRKIGYFYAIQYPYDWKGELLISTRTMLGGAGSGDRAVLPPTHSLNSLNTILLNDSPIRNFLPPAVLLFIPLCS